METEYWNICPYMVMLLYLFTASGLNVSIKLNETSFEFQNQFKNNDESTC